MKRATNHKNLISFAVVLILLLSLSATSFAVWNPFDYQRNRAFVAAALTALNISFQSQQMAAQSVVEYIADPLEVNYTYIDAWQDRPQLQVWPDYVEIDGVKYTDVWISNEAAEKFRVNAFDFKTAYEIASNSSGMFAEGVGTTAGAKVYDVNGTWTTQHSIVPGTAGSYNTVGDYYVQNVSNSGGFKTRLRCTGSPSYHEFPWWGTSNYPVDVYYTINQGNNAVVGNVLRQNGTISTASNFNSSQPFIAGAFDYDYVASTIPADERLPADTGMMIRVPSNDPLGNPYFDDFLTDYPEFNQDTPVTIDVDVDPDIMNKLDDLIDILIPIIPNINNNLGDVQFIENHTEPAPVINNLLPDTYSQEIMQPIVQNFQQTQETIQNMGDTIVETIPKIDDICNNIDTAPYHDLDTGLDHLPTVFLPFITDLRSALGIWHYVTQWLSQISTTFAFVTGCLVGTSIMTPIYAAIAGFMCIKVYRRMTG